MIKFFLFIKKIHFLLLFILLESLAIHYYANSTSYTKVKLVTASNYVVGGIVCSESINVAGDVFTEDIQTYIRQQHNMRIGERTAEDIKIAVGAALSELDEEPEDFEVTGPNILTSLPSVLSISYSEMAYALEKSLVKIDAAIMKVLEMIPPELYADIAKKGVYLAGGGALLKGLDRRLYEKTNIPFHVADDPLRAVARGTGIALKNIGRFSFLMK